MFNPSTSEGVIESFLQIIHPFYVFQIASIILWSLDDYYYYAFCIALISAISITTTLLDTRKVSTANFLVQAFTYEITDDITNARNVQILLCCKRL